MIRHLIPRVAWLRWCGAALTVDPAGGVEMPLGPCRSLRIVMGESTVTPQNDEVEGGVICIQWLGLMVEIAVGKVR